MDFISLLGSKKNSIQEINKYDFNPKYCEQHNLIWNKLLRLSTRRNQKFFFSEFPQDIVILISKFSLGINTSEYIYYLNSLHSLLEHVSFNAQNGNIRGFNYGQQNIKDLLLSLKSKIGTDFETIGLYEYIYSQLEKFQIDPIMEKKYIQNRIDLDLKRTHEYAQSGNLKMTEFYKKKIKYFMLEFAPTELFRLENIEVDHRREKSFKKKDFWNSIQLAERCALSGDRQNFEYYKQKLVRNQEYMNNNINNQISKIEEIITSDLEIQYLSDKIFKYLDYAKNKAEVKDQIRMDRYLNQIDRYYQQLIKFSIDKSTLEDINQKINSIYQIFNCPLL